MKRLSGGCCCGKIRYEALGKAYHATWCHCLDCRRSSGAPAMAWFSVTVDGFRVTQGTLRRFASSDRAERGFCADCGTSLTYHAKAHPGEVDIATATLDDPEMAPPQDHVWFSRHIGWVRPGDGLPTYAAERPGA